MSDKDGFRKVRKKILVRYSCTTNDVNDPNYFDDYYEEKEVTVKVKH